ncbi:MAG TPA: DUF2207 domain-containing protein [Candidatus Bathyarchaeia archaeon]|nr:DUF2207 domain-containing protein [Candidatus Bathyarchaeia archaeon]
MKFFLCLFCVGIFFSFSGAKSAFAADSVRQYQYDEILTNIQINADTTFDVEERQVFDYQGEYNQGWRTIPFKKFDGITNIQVIDGETDLPLTYSSRELEKTTPGSWGKFTYNRKNGAENIIWYYDVKDAKHLWILKYRIHGGIGFFKDYDELYWNILTDYAVPVRKAETHVFLPKEVPDTNGMYINYYSDQPAAPEQPDSYSISGEKSFDYSSKNIGPLGKLTILAQWPKGIVDQGQYFRDFLNIYWGYLAALLIIVLGLISGSLYWFFTEKFRKGSGTIIAQYAPPKNLRPAVGEIICKERVTEKTWPATLVDLAVRGYVKIKEKKPNVLKKAVKIFLFIFFPAALSLFILLVITDNFSHATSFASIFEWLIVTFFVGYFFLSVFRATKGMRDSSKDYEIEKIKEFSNDTSLEEYEKKFLAAIFGNGPSFSTDMTGNEEKQALYKKIQEAKKELLADTEMGTQAYEVGISGEEKRNTVFFIIFAVYLFFLFIVSGNIVETQSAVFLTTLVLLALEVFYFKYEARLNDEGYILKDEWLGFKLYLETAEKYRLQNLTPDLFEKYLPYAIIFGVEKKWAKNFDSLNMQPPEWYGGSAGISGSGAASFSASSFTSSFSASFASSFSSSGAGGAGGAGGGGGGAGGGGGGGGGGAG